MKKNFISSNFSSFFLAKNPPPFGTGQVNVVATGGYRSQPIRLRGEPLADPTLIPSAKPSLTAPMSRCWWACPSRIPGKTLCRESATEPPKEMDPNCWNASLSDSPHQIRKQEACLEFLFPGMVNGPADVLWKGDFFSLPPICTISVGVILFNWTLRYHSEVSQRSVYGWTFNCWAVPTPAQKPIGSHACPLWGVGLGYLPSQTQAVHFVAGDRIPPGFFSPTLGGEGGVPCATPPRGLVLGLVSADPGGYGSSKTILSQQSKHKGRKALSPTTMIARDVTCEEAKVWKGRETYLPKQEPATEEPQPSPITRH